MDEQKISSLVGEGVVDELKLLISTLEDTQRAFAPIMEQVRATYTSMGAGSKDVKNMIEAFSKYNQIIEQGGNEIKKYNTIQEQIQAVRNKLAATNKEELLTLERLKESQRNLSAEIKNAVTTEAAESRQVETATRAKIGNMNATRQLAQEIKRQIEVQNGTIMVNGKEEQTLRAKAATLAQLKEKYMNVSSAIRAELVPIIQKLDKELKASDDLIGNHTRHVGDYGRGLAALIPGLSRFTTGFGMVGVGVMAGVEAFKVFTNSVKYGIDVIKNYEQANANLASILGVTTRETRALQEQSLLLGRTTEWGATAVTEAQTQLAYLGFSQQTILNMTKSLLGFATAMNTSLSAAAEVAGVTLRAFNLSSSETDRVLSMLTIAANRTAMDFNFLHQAIGIVGASASMAHVPLKDTLSLLGVLSNSGLDASRSATALRNIFLYLADDSKKLGKEMKGTTMDAESISKAFIALRNKGVDLADMFQLTDKRAVNALAVLIQNAEQIIVLRDSISQLTGALDVMRGTRLDTLEGDMKLLKASWDGWWLSFRENTPFIRDTIRTIRDGLNALTMERYKKLQNEEGSSNYATDLVNQDQITAKAKNASNVLNALGDTYRSLLGDEDAANKEFQVILDTRDALSKKEIAIWQRSADNLEKTRNRIDNTLKKGVSELSWGERGHVGTGVDQITEAHERLSTENATAKQLISQIDAMSKRIDKDTDAGKNTDDLAVRLRESRSSLTGILKSIDITYKQLQDGYDYTINTLGNRSDTTFKNIVIASRNQDKTAYGKYLTGQRSVDAVQGAIDENSRTLNPMADPNEKYHVDTKKEEQEAERRRKQLKDIENAEDVAQFTELINQHKELSESAKALADDEMHTWEARYDAASLYASELKVIAELEYHRKLEELKDKTIKADVGVTGKVTNKNVIDPITGDPQLDWEKLTYQQRLALKADYERQVGKIEDDASKQTIKLADGEEKDDEERTKNAVEIFKKGLEQRLKDVEAERAKEQLKLTALYDNQDISKGGLKNAQAVVDVRFDKISLDAVQLYWEEKIKTLDLPEMVQATLKDVFDKFKQDAQKNLDEGTAKENIITGNINNNDATNGVKRNGKRTILGGIKDLFSPPKDEVKYKANGSVDEKASTNEANKLGKGIQGVLSSKEVGIVEKLYSDLTNVITGFYQQELQNIADVKAAEQDRYDTQKKLLEASAANLEANHNAGLLSEANYNAQKNKNARQQKALDDAKTAKDKELDAEKRKIQVQEAKWTKANSYVQAVMSTASGVANALTVLPTPLGIILASVVGAMGAAQIALIASQTIPAYAKGTKDHVGGAMLVGDAGVHEFGVTPDNKMFITANTPTYMDAPAHTQIFKNEQSFLDYLELKDSTVDHNGKIINVAVDTDYFEQRRILRNIDGGIARLNANELYRIELERNNKYFEQW